MDLSKNEKFDLVKILPFIFSILFLGLLFVVLMKYPFLSVDEGFTRGFLDFSFAEMIKLTAIDVHPPLYYIIMMAFVKACQALSLNFNLIQMMKFPSLIPYLIILVFSLTKLRKEYGLLMGGIFSLTLIVASDFFIQYLTARMYSWAMIFLVISFFYVKDILEKNDLKSWILFTVFSVLGAYTHYFTGVSSVVIYLMLFVWILVNRKDGAIKENLKKFFISVVVGIVIYVPWMFVLVDQMKFVKGNYWVQPISINDIFSFFSYCLTTAHNQIYVILSFLVVLAIILLLIKKFIETRENEDLYLVMGVFVFLGTVGFGVLSSVFYKPILVDRYLIPAIGIFWLCLSIKISSLDLKKSVVLLIILMIALVGAVNVYHEVKDIQKMNDWTNKEFEVLDKINNNNSIVIFNTYNYYIRTHMDLDKIYKGYDSVKIYNYENNLTYKFDNLEDEQFVIPDDLSKYPDKDVYFMRFYTLDAKFPKNVNATMVGTAQHTDFYKLKLK